MIYIHPKTQALIFDCDGTIADNMRIHNEAWLEVAKRYEINITSEQLTHFNGIPTVNILNHLLPKAHPYGDIGKIVHEKELLAENKIHHSQPIAPVVEIIKRYHNKLPMVVISGGKEYNVTKTLKALDLIHYFEFIITADDSHPTKDQPEAFTLIADRLNVDADKCHVFEDGKPGLINALKANMMVTDIRAIYP